MATGKIFVVFKLFSILTDCLELYTHKQMNTSKTREMWIRLVDWVGRVALMSIFRLLHYIIFCKIDYGINSAKCIKDLSLLFLKTACAFSIILIKTAIKINNNWFCYIFFFSSKIGIASTHPLQGVHLPGVYYLPYY